MKKLLLFFLLLWLLGQHAGAEEVSSPTCVNNSSGIPDRGALFDGDEKQSQQLIDYLKDESPDNLWQSNIFGKSVYDLIQEGLSAKLTRMPDDVRGKFRGTLTRIVNEGASGLICLIL